MVDLRECPFCGEHLVAVPAFSTRSTTTYMHGEKIHGDDACIIANILVNVSEHDDDWSRVRQWNTRAGEQ